MSTNTSTAPKVKIYPSKSNKTHLIVRETNLDSIRYANVVISCQTTAAYLLNIHSRVSRQMLIHEADSESWMYE